MSQITYLRASILVIAFSAAVFVENQPSPAATPNIAKQQARLQLREQPARPQQVLSVQKQLVSARRQQATSPSVEVTLVGQIGGMPNVWPQEHKNFPWYDGQASFFLVDSKVAAQFAAHAKKHGGSHNCAFCQSLAEKNAHAIAVVNFVDEQGQILPIDARQLLDVKERQTVVVRGKAKLLGGRMLVVDADGIYVPRSER
jgi:hypothetical protein